jgi:hypothetical protein
VAAIEAEELRRTYSTHTELLIGVIYGIAGYGLLRWFEIQSRLHATLKRS